MARYIDADALKTAILTKYRANWEIPCSSEDRLIQRVVTDLRVLIEQSVTADVVPKSEVAQILENNQMCLEIIETQDQTIQIAKANIARLQTLARKIFEEIERKITHDIDVNNACIVELDDSAELYHRVKGELFVLCDIQDFIAELKNKYTEEQE